METQPPYGVVMKTARSGNNPIDLANDAYFNSSEVGKSAPAIQELLSTVGEHQIPTALPNYSAWERERSLGRGLKELKKRGGRMAKRVRVRSNAHRNRSMVIDDLVLNFDSDGYATIPDGEVYKVERFSRQRPGRLTVIYEQVETVDDLLAAAQEAMAVADAPPAEDEKPVEPVVTLPEISAQEAAAELGLDVSQVEGVEQEQLPAPKEEKPKKKGKKE